MKIQEIREIIKLVDQSSIEEFIYENEGVKVQMKKQGTVVHAAPAAAVPVQTAAPVKETAAPAPAPVQAAATEQPAEAPAPAVQQDASLHQILSPMVGTFYQSPSPDEAPYVQPGTKVSSDTVVCIVEAMKLFNEIEAEVEGEVTEILVKDGQLVEYGQPLFLVKTN